MRILLLVLLLLTSCNEPVNDIHDIYKPRPKLVYTYAEGDEVVLKIGRVTALITSLHRYGDTPLYAVKYLNIYGGISQIYVREFEILKKNN